VTVQAEEGDAIARLYAHRAQSAREACGAFGKLRVGETKIAAHDRSPARILLLGVTQTTKRRKRDIHDFCSTV
jgi:hypothetical protein